MKNALFFAWLLLLTTGCPPKQPAQGGLGVKNGETVGLLIGAHFKNSLFPFETNREEKFRYVNIGEQVAAGVAHLQPAARKQRQVGDKLVGQVLIDGAAGMEGVVKAPGGFTADSFGGLPAFTQGISAKA